MFKKLKHSLFSLTLALSLLLPFFYLAPAHAVSVLPECTGSVASSPVCKSKGSGTTSNNSIVGPHGIITKATLILSIIVGILSVIMILISSFRFIVSNGDPNAVAGARNTLIYSLVGVAVAVLGVVIVEFILSNV